MKLYLHNQKYVNAYYALRRILSRLSFEFLFESLDSGLISCYRDGQTLQIMDMKINKTENCIKLLIISSQLTHSKGNLIADPEMEATIATALMDEISTGISTNEFTISPFDYYLAG